ncbi:MAG: class I SAM-dependent methyltransferase [Pseudomonadota bacterium]
MDDNGFFDDQIAAHYDNDVADQSKHLDATIGLLTSLAGPGPVLEFAIGTGRLALPLADRGIEVQGIELSRPMIAQLRAKPGGETMEVAIGDMTTTRMDRSYTLVFLAFNTICNLTTQDAQIACFENAAQHLSPGGSFLIEAPVPPLQRLPRGEKRLAFAQSETHWGIDEIDVATQSFTSHHLWNRSGRVERVSIPFRYVWPSELDLMARLSGLELHARWETWTRAPFTAQSETHISVWRKPKGNDR